jgi:hypothetical protein
MQMKPILAMAVLAGLLAVPAAFPTDAGAALSNTALQEQPATPPPSRPPAEPAPAPAGVPDINIDIERESTAWYVDPMWLAIGGIGLAVLVILIVAISRGGTTVVND